MVIPHELGLYEELVMALGNRDSRGVRLIACTPEFAQFALPDGSALVVVRHNRGGTDRLDRMVVRVCEGLRQGKLYLVAAGGDRDARQVLEDRRPSSRVGKQVLVFAVDDERSVWFGRRSKPNRDLDAAFDTVRKPLRKSAEDFASWLLERQEAAQVLRERVEAYNQKMLEQKPRVTQCLVAVLVLVFGLEWLFGGPQSVPTLVRMGALLGEGGTTTEAWRLLSHSFLHGSLMHLAGNAAILWLLGGFLERLLGGTRLLTLWTLSILAGGIAALSAPSAASVLVGASGGGWGLMTAAGVLALRPRGIIPDALAHSLRRNIGHVLILNLAISFVPGISLSAHIGGGIAGALVMVSGLGTLGLGATHQVAEGRTDRGPAMVARTLGLICAGALLASLALGITRGEPWVLSGEPEWARRDLGSPGISLELPGSLPEPEESQLPEGRLLTFGEPLASPVRVEVSIDPILTQLGRPTQSPIRLYREYRKVRQRLLNEPLLRDAVRIGEPVEAEETEVFFLDETFGLPRGGMMWRHTRVVPSAVLVLSVIADEADGEKRAPWAARIIGSLRTGYESAEVGSN